MIITGRLGPIEFTSRADGQTIIRRSGFTLVASYETQEQATAVLCAIQEKQTAILH